MDEEFKTFSWFITWMVGLALFCGVGIAACDSVFESPNTQIRRMNHEATLMKVCVDNKMEWRDGNCLRAE